MTIARCAHASSAFDRFIDIRALSHARQQDKSCRQVDILIDLRAIPSRPAGDIGLAPAPVQVNYLGYPATMGRISSTTSSSTGSVVPAGQQPFLRKAGSASGSYQVTTQGARWPWPHVGQDHGLPRGLVFASSTTVTRSRRILRYRDASAAVDSGQVYGLLEANQSVRAICVRRRKNAVAIPAVDLCAAGSTGRPSRTPPACRSVSRPPCPATPHTQPAMRYGRTPGPHLQRKHIRGPVAGSLLTAVGMPENARARSKSMNDGLALARAAGTPDRAATEMEQDRDASALFDSAK